MNLWSRRAAVNSRLLAVMALLVLAVGLFWGCRIFDTPDDPAPDTYKLWCAECKEFFIFPAAEAKGRERQNEKVLCPKCGTFNGTWGRPRESEGVISP